MNENIVINSSCCNGIRRKIHPGILSRLGILKGEFRFAFDYFIEDFGASLHNRQINKECILINNEVSGLQTDYPNLRWNVSCGGFMIHQTNTIQEGLCGLEDVNYAGFNSGHYDGTIMIDAWFGDIDSWVSICMRQLELKYKVVDFGNYEWERIIQLELYRNKKLLYTSQTRSTNMLNSFPLGMSIRGNEFRVSNTDEKEPVLEVHNEIIERYNPITIGSSYSYIQKNFTGIAGIYFFGGRHKPIITL